MKTSLLALLPIAAFAQQWTQPLRFRADGTFKVVEVRCVRGGGALFPRAAMFFYFNLLLCPRAANPLQYISQRHALYK